MRRTLNGGMLLPCSHQQLPLSLIPLGHMSFKEEVINIQIVEGAILERVVVALAEGRAVPRQMPL